MNKDVANKKIEAYRKIYKTTTKLTDKEFDSVVQSFSDPNHALSYLRGYLNTHVGMSPRK